MATGAPVHEALLHGDVLRTVFLETWSCGPKLRLVCRTWRDVVDQLAEESSRDLVAMLEACSFVIARRPPRRWVLQYCFYEQSTREAPSYVCARCRKKVFELASCTHCVVASKKRFSWVRVFLGPLCGTFAVAVAARALRARNGRQR